MTIEARDQKPMLYNSSGHFEKCEHNFAREYGALMQRMTHNPFFRSVKRTKSQYKFEAI
jgi:hypothetical protein